jgi:hypothetical protein
VIEIDRGIVGEIAKEIYGGVLVRFTYIKRVCIPTLSGIFDAVSRKASMNTLLGLT